MLPVRCLFLPLIGDVSPLKPCFIIQAKNVFPALRSAAFSLQMSVNSQTIVAGNRSSPPRRYNANTQSLFLPPGFKHTQSQLQLVLKTQHKRLHVKISITAIGMSHSFTYLYIHISEINNYFSFADTASCQLMI